jgi:uncharacterized protein YcbX
MSRFRPNIVLDGLPAWQEDVIHKVKIGDSLVLEFMKPCERCGVPAIDQDTGKVQSGVDVKDREPIRTLRSYRFGADKESGLKGAFFGQSATPRTLGTISVGDEVEILEERAVHPALAEVKLGYGG